MASSDDFMSRILPSLGVVLLGAIIIWSVSTIQTQALAIAEMRSALTELKVRPRPPEWVRHKLEAVELEQRRLQRQIDLIEKVLGTKGLELPPYTGSNRPQSYTGPIDR